MLHLGAPFKALLNGAHIGLPQIILASRNSEISISFCLKKVTFSVLPFDKTSFCDPQIVKAHFFPDEGHLNNLWPQAL